MNILITGGTGLIGKQLIKDMSNAGHCIWFTSRSSQAIEEVERYSNTDRITGIEIDLSKANFEESLLPMLPENLDAVIHAMRDASNLRASAGIVSRSDFSAELLMNVIIPYELTMLLVKAYIMLNTVINIGSQYGAAVPPPALYDNYQEQSFIHYGVSKSALIHLTKELAVRLAPENVSVNCVSYGGVEGRTDPKFSQRYGQLCPQGRMLNKDEIADMILLLLNQSGLSITGQNLQIDGGWTLC